MRKLFLFLATLSAFGQMRQNVFEAIPSASGTTVGEYRFRELPANGVNYSGWKSAPSVAANVLFTIPAAAGVLGDCLTQTDGAGTLGFNPCGLTNPATLTSPTAALVEPSITLYNSSGGGQGCYSFSFNIVDGSNIPLSRLCSELVNGASGVGTAFLQFYNASTAGTAADLVKTAEFIDAGQFNVYKGLRVNATGNNSVASLVVSDLAVGHEDAPVNWVSGTFEAWNVSNSTTDFAALRGITRVKGGTNVQSRGVEAIGTREATAGNAWYTWGAEVHIHSAVAPTTNSLENVGIFVHDICGLAFAGGCGVEVKNNIGVLVGGTSGWEYGFRYQDLTGTLDLFSASESGNVSAYRSFTAFGSTGQTVANYDTAGAHGGAILLRDGGPGAGNGGVALFGAAQGYFGAIKASLTNGLANTTGNLSISLRAAATDPLLSELAVFSPQGVNLAPAISSYFTKVRKLEIADITGSVGFWDLQSTVSIATASLYMRDNVGDPVIEHYRQFAGTPSNFSYFFTDLVPAKRLIANGHSVDDTVFPAIGRSTARVSKYWGTDIDISAGTGSIITTGDVTAGTVDVTSGLGYLIAGTSVITSGRYAFLTNLDINTATTPVVGHVWTATSTAGAGSWQAPGGGAPFIDSTAIIKGSVDPTKTLLIEVDGFTSGIPRTLTPQNASYTIAGTNIQNTFNTTQTMAANLIFSSDNLWDIGASGATRPRDIHVARNLVVASTASADILNGTGAFPIAIGGTSIFTSGRVIQNVTSFNTDWLPTLNNFYNVGNTTFRLALLATVNANFSGTITAPNGNAGQSATYTVRDAAGTGTCTLIFSGGLKTGGTC